MHIIRPHQASITLFSRHGSVDAFPSAKQALKKLGYAWIATNVGPHLRTFNGTSYEEYSYIMRSDLGEIVTATSFSALRIKPGIHQRVHLFRHWNGEVPGTGKRSRTRCFRHIRYANAKRASQYFPDEGEIAPRAVRYLNRLADAWDEHIASSRRYRNWKQFRKTQWR
ncbi:hypothetical protein ACO0LF_31300 [Undibacterium sp. Di27W]|uniref:hypothetical protein n=1 Tax=Undibacterium sp. Di27W TaxID=3413036 RepID=UPI003BF01F7C